MQITPLGCFAPEPSLSPPGTQPVDSSAAACAEACNAFPINGFPYIFLLSVASGCRCAKAYNTSGFSMPAQADGSCVEPTVPGFAWSSCSLGGATFIINQRKKGYFGGEVRLGRWKVGSSVTLHYGTVPASFRSVWHAQALSTDPFAEFSKGGSWTFRLAAPATKAEIYTFVGVKWAVSTNPASTRVQATFSAGLDASLAPHAHSDPPRKSLPILA